MKIAIATHAFTQVSGHAGQTRQWLIYDLANHNPARLLPVAQRIELAPGEVLHNFTDSSPHPLDGIDLVVARSAGDGFIRHMKKRGADVLLTSEEDPARALTCIMARSALPDPRFDVSTTLCKLRDLLSRY